MRKSHCFMLIVLLVISNISSAQSLDEYVAVAIENNPGVQAKYIEFEAALQKVAQANSLPDPKISLGGFIFPVETRVGPQQARVSLVQMFPWFGTLKTAGNVYKYQAESKFQRFLDAKNNLEMQVKIAWYSIYKVRQDIHFQQDNLNILMSYKTIATSSFKNNKGTMVDVIRVDIKINQVETDIALLKDQLIPFQIRFNKLLNRSDTTEIVVNDSLYLKSVVSGTKESLFLSNPLLKSFDLDNQSARFDEEMARKLGRPTIGVGVDYVFVGERHDVAVPNNGRNALMPKVAVSLPIYRRKNNAAIRESRLDQEGILKSKIDYENQLATAYELARFDLKKSKELYELYTAQTAKTVQVIRLLETAYANTGNDFEEILRMQQRLLEYKILQTSAVKDYYIALAELKYLTGN